MINSKIDWSADPSVTLPAIDWKLKNKAYRIAMNKASAPMKAALIEATPNDTGMMDKSLRIKIKFYKKKNTWCSIIGPKSNFEKKGKKPANYFALVNKGTKYFAGRNYIITAFDSTKDKFDAVLKDKLAELFNQYASEIVH